MSWTEHCVLRITRTLKSSHVSPINNFELIYHFSGWYRYFAHIVFGEFIENLILIEWAKREFPFPSAFYVCTSRHPLRPSSILIYESYKPRKTNNKYFRVIFMTLDYNALSTYIWVHQCLTCGQVLYILFFSNNAW